MLSLSSLVTFVVYLIVVGLIWWLLNYLVDAVGMPEPFYKVCKVVLLVVAVLFVIGLLLSLVGVQVIRW